MSEPFLAEVKIFGFNFPPRGWAQCDGQILPINQNQSLYSLLGTTYGGDGRSNFALPELRGRACAHVGPGFSLGQRAGRETEILTPAQIPNHTHQLVAYSDVADSNNPQSRRYGQSGIALYHDYDANGVADMNANAVANAGGGQGHQNMHPYLTLNFCIATQGLFPSRN